MEKVGISAPGLAKLRRDLGKIDASLRKAADAHIREIAKDVRAEAQRRAPVRSGRLRRSYRYSLSAKGSSIYSALEYAPVIEFGGTIAPRGVDIKIEKSAPVYGAIAAKAGDIEEQLGGVLDAVAKVNGFTAPGGFVINQPTL